MMMTVMVKMTKVYQCAMTVCFHILAGLVLILWRDTRLQCGLSVLMKLATEWVSVILYQCIVHFTQHLCCQCLDTYN